MDVKNNKKISEFISIRKKFKASREQFGTVFLGKSGAVIINYETGVTEIPESVMMLARAWSILYDHMTGKNNGK